MLHLSEVWYKARRHLTSCMHGKEYFEASNNTLMWRILNHSLHLDYNTGMLFSLINATGIGITSVHGTASSEETWKTSNWEPAIALEQSRYEGALRKEGLLAREVTGYIWIGGISGKIWKNLSTSLRDSITSKIQLCPLRRLLSPITFPVLASHLVRFVLPNNKDIEKCKVICIFFISCHTSSYAFSLFFFFVVVVIVVGVFFCKTITESNEVDKR